MRSGLTTKGLSWAFGGDNATRAVGLMIGISYVGLYDRELHVIDKVILYMILFAPWPTVTNWANSFKV